MYKQLKRFMSENKQILGDSLLPKSSLERLASYFQALSHPSRLHLLNCLCHSEKGVGVSDLAKQTDLSIANVSRQLALLAQNGLVIKEAQGNSAIYSIADSNLHQMCDLVCASIGNKMAADAEDNDIFLNK
jgi:DNA-binding transcriptional ArsR family regulator